MAGRGDGFKDDVLADITASQKMISAMSGSLLTSLLVTPLDVVRVRLQSQSSTSPSLARAMTPSTSTAATLANSLPAGATTAELGVTACCREVFFAGNNMDYCFAGPARVEGLEATAGCAVQEVRKATYSSTMDGLRKIARHEGFTTLWRGLSPTLVMTIPANIIYFTGYDWLRYSPASPLARVSLGSEKSDHYAPLTAGSLARVLAATAVSPIELVRTRMQAASGAPSTTNHLMDTFRGIADMVAASGYSSLWRGLTLTLWRDVPFSGLYWWGYESIRSSITDAREEGWTGRRRRSQRRGRHEGRDDEGDDDMGMVLARRRSQSRENHAETFVDSFVAGATSGALASIVTMPFDVGKTRTQIYHKSSSSSSSSAPEARSMTRLLWHIFKTEGFPGLWRGWIPRTLKVAPACAIMISSYEVGKRVFRGINERERG